MSRPVVIKVEDVSKLYRLGQVGTGTLTHDLKRWWARTRGKEDPYLKIGMENDRTKRGESDYAWSLKDIHFEVQRGDTLGIIGKNGAGKSTLLKILSRVTTPTEGKISIKGRIASLLEVGTGFHPELTGRENVYMNGAILGMTKKEITAKFDEIVAFSGVEMYIDTPVKRYSSGMYVRLAFAVAAHLEPEILIVDEVLAVGDAEFQKKCLGKMGDVARDGRTIIFVSHNMTAIHSLCNKTIMLEKGKMKMIGETNQVIAHYLNAYVNSSSSKIWRPEEAPGDATARLHSVRLVNSASEDLTNSYLEDEVFLVIKYECLKQDEKLNLSISVMTAEEEYLFSSPSVSDEKWCNQPHPVGVYKSVCKLPANFFNVANYKVHVLLVRNLSEIIVHAEDIVVMEKLDSGKHRKGYFGKWNGITRPLLDWSTEAVR